MPEDSTNTDQYLLVESWVYLLKDNAHPIHLQQSSLYVLLILFALIVKLFSGHPIIFLPVFALTAYVLLSTTGTFAGDYGLSLSWLTLFWFPSDYIFLTDVQHTLCHLPPAPKEPIKKASLCVPTRCAVTLFTTPRGIGWVHQPPTLPMAPLASTHHSSVLSVSEATNELLQEHSSLIIHLILSVYWKDELAKLSGIPTDWINVLGTVMDEDCMLKNPNGQELQIIEAEKKRHPSDSMILKKTKSRQHAMCLPAHSTTCTTHGRTKEKHDEREELQHRIDTDIAEWFSCTNAKAVKLGTKYDKQPQYFLNIFFQGGTHTVNHQEKTNPYNAFKAEKAAQHYEVEVFVIIFLELGLNWFQKIKWD
ncbi:hypothetical protein DFH08DRAFT_819635 [Mycena albidolilacea]|uniref:Uncharacterized protein n=1 Tax=Mycena albidolilacea TaxID=1033008 RepID=A0AAD6ZE36_9AGAR|nr:hypothetical protein DFH08DRAFT_819635 [Mycena albidolilacea]